MSDTTLQPRFRPGDVVQLKSGGLPMTVEMEIESLSERCFLCRWFDGSELKTDSFPASTIQHMKKSVSYNGGK